MAVRKIPKNHLFVTGGYSSRKSEEMDAFESLLEKDYLLLLDFDDTVESFDVQPVRIPVKGVARGYVPDVLVKYRSDLESREIRKPLLAEVKRSDFLAKHAAKYAPKFAAAVVYAENLGWEFRPIDETEIRLPRLRNIKFLREYRNVSPSETDCLRVMEAMDRRGRSSSSERILADLAQIDEARLYWLPVIWSMVFQKRVLTDLDIPFGGDVELHLPGYQL
jgi:TnsA endonuclease N terminal/TnsA endonuclease C terminal